MKKICSLLIIFSTINATAQMNQGKILTKNSYLEIPFTETKTEIHTKANLKGDDLDFMLDTGAPTFISTELQEKYKFPTVYKGKTEDASGNKVKTQIVIIDTIKFGPFIFTGIPAVVIDMKKSPLECLNLPGNIGSNILRHLYVQFDIANHRVAFADSKALLKNQAPDTKPMLINGQSDVFFSVKLNDNITDTIHYDSGDGQLYSISKRAMGNYVAAYPEEVIRNGYGTMFMGIGGAGESFPQYVAKPGSIKIGRYNLTGGAVTIAGNDRSRMGRDLLNYGLLQLNYPDSTYSFESYSSPAIPAHFDFGFHPVIDGDDIVVGCVWKNTLAEKGGIQSGDQLLKVDDIDLTVATKCDATTAARNINKIEKNTITVTFRHKKQKPQTVTLERKPL